jgi:hypothetical protein
VKPRDDADDERRRRGVDDDDDATTTIPKPNETLFHSSRTRVLRRLFRGMNQTTRRSDAATLIRDAFLRDSRRARRGVVPATDVARARFPRRTRTRGSLGKNSSFRSPDRRRRFVILASTTRRRTRAPKRRHAFDDVAQFPTKRHHHVVVVVRERERQRPFESDHRLYTYRRLTRVVHARGHDAASRSQRVRGGHDCY